MLWGKSDVFSTYKIQNTDLSGELPQTCGDRQTLFKQEVIKGVATECFEIHLVFIIPELIRGV